MRLNFVQFNSPSPYIPRQNIFVPFRYFLKSNTLTSTRFAGLMLFSAGGFNPHWEKKYRDRDPMTIKKAGMDSRPTKYYFLFQKTFVSEGALFAHPCVPCGDLIRSS